MAKHRKRSSRRGAKVVGVGLVAGGLLLGAPAGISVAEPIGGGDDGGPGGPGGFGGGNQGGGGPISGGDDGGAGSSGGIGGGNQGGGSNQGAAISVREAITAHRDAVTTAVGAARNGTQSVQDAINQITAAREDLRSAIRSARTGAG